MEGLPVRQWRKTTAVVDTVPPKENSSAVKMQSTIWKELLMPRGAELYSPVCQALLRAARMGQVNRPPPPPEDEKEQGEDEDAQGELDVGFLTFKWSQIPKEMEEPEIEFLAKRRRGLPSAYGTTLGAPGLIGQMRKTKVRRVDGEGHASVWDVLAPEGTMVEGEVVANDEVMTEALAPGTVVEGVGIANAEGIVIASDQVLATPPRRRPPPPKRKPKGPGRGRKKNKSVIINGNSDLNMVVSQDGLMAAAAGSGPNGTKHGDNTIRMGTDGTAQVGEASVLQDLEDGSDDEDEEGDEGEDGDREEGEVSPTPDPDAAGVTFGSPPKHVPAIVEPERMKSTLAESLLSTGEHLIRELSSSPDLPLSAAQLSQHLSPQLGLSRAAQSQSTLQPEQAQDIKSLVLQDEVKFASTDVLLPVVHEPLDDPIEPKVPDRTDPASLQDGGNDLLGSLERHLNEKQ